MNKSVYRFTLDVQARHAQISLPVRLNETARALEITLSERGFPIKIDDGCRAVFYAVKPDGNPLVNDCKILHNRVIRYEFTNQTATAEGVQECQIRLYGVDGFNLAAPRFIMVVDGRVVYNDDVEISESEKTALDRIFTDEAERAEAEVNREEAEEERRLAEATRESNEEVREENERLRVAAENSRQAAELAREAYISELQERVENGEFDGEDGVDGKDGKDGLPGINGTNGRDGTDGEDGEDGFSPTIIVTKVGMDTKITITDVNGTKDYIISNTQGLSPTITPSKSGKTTTLTIVDVEGTKTATILDGADGKDGTNGTNGTNGKDGADGEDGYTPVKGVDYFTESDITEIVNQVMATLPDAEEASF